MKNPKVKIFKAIYYLLNFIIIIAIGYLSSLALNANLMTHFNIHRLITWSVVALIMISSEFTLSFKIHQID